MFWYQCRYCKVNFDQWEKLVTHRRDEHKQEFEALKRRSLLLLSRQEEAAKRKNKLIGKEEENKCSNVNSTPVKSLPLYITTNRMKPTTNATTTHATTNATLSSSPSTPATPTRRPNQSSSKELDAKDLENQEISLCIPSSSSALGLRFSSPLYSRDSPLPFLFLTPTTSPSQNGGSTISRNSNPRTERFYRSGHAPAPSSTFTSSSIVTPPVTLPRQLPPSPLLSVEELVLNMHMNWSPPAVTRKAVQYHEISDDDEIEFSITPSSGSQITVTKHSVRGGGKPFPVQGPVYVNGESREYLAESRIQRRVTKHVMVENLEHELQMTCSSSSTNGGGEDVSVPTKSNDEPITTYSSLPERTVTGRKSDGNVSIRRKSNDGVVNGKRSGGDKAPSEDSRGPDRVGGRLRSELTERRLKRLHSQLQLGQQSNIAKLNSASASTSRSSSSTSSNSGEGVGNGCKRMRMDATNTASSLNGNLNGDGDGGGQSRVADNKKRPRTISSGSAKAPPTMNSFRKSPFARVSLTRINTRASPRRPKK